MSPPTPEVLPLLLGEGGLDAEGPAFEAWCASHAAARCRVWLGAELERPLLAEPGARFTGAAALADYARRVLGHYEPAAEGASVAAWRSRSRFGASLLLPPADLAAIEAAASRHAVRLEGVHPLWAGALHWARRERPALLEDSWLLVAQGRLVCALELRAGGLVQLRRSWLEDDAAVGLEGLVAELGTPGRPVVAVGFGLRGEPPRSVRVLGGLDGSASAFVQRLAEGLPVARRAGSSSWCPDFAAPAESRRPLAGWALALTGATVLALAGADAASAWTQRQVALRPPPASSGAIEPPPSARRATPEATMAKAAAGATALDRLAYPWEPLFGVGETARPERGAWLAFEHRAGQSTLRLLGQAPGADEALAVAAAMARSPALADAALARSEPREGGGVRFEIVARVAARGSP